MKRIKPYIIFLGILSFSLTSFAQIVTDNTICVPPPTIEEDDGHNRFVTGFLDWVAARKVSKDSIKIAQWKQENTLQERLYTNVYKDLADSILYPSPTWDSTLYRNKRSLSPDQNFDVFGWHPYWMGNAFKSYNFDLLTIISFFSYDINPRTGGCRNCTVVNQWLDTELVDLAHADSTKVLLTVTSHGYANNEQFLGEDLPIQQLLIDSLIALIDAKGGDGIDVNFELIPKKRKAEFQSFIRELSIQLKKSNPAYLLMLTIPAFDYASIYDFSRLNPYVDKYVIMGYDFHHRNSGPGPVAPLDPIPDGIDKDLRSSVYEYLENDLPLGNTIMALPYYAGDWLKIDEREYFSLHLTYREIQNYIEKNGVIPTFDEESTSKYYEYRDKDGNLHEVWFDDSTTLALKYDWIIEEKLGGMGIWALGYDNGYQNLWALIDEKFTQVKLPQVNSAPLALLRNVRLYSNIIIVTIIFALLFVLLGFCLSLFDWRVREAFFLSRQARLIYMGFFFLLLLLLLSLVGYLPTLWIMAITCIVLGLIVMRIVNHYFGIQRSKLP